MVGLFFPLICGVAFTTLCFFSEKAKILKKLSSIFLAVVYVIDAALLLIDSILYWNWPIKYALYTMIILTAMFFFSWLLYFLAAKLYLSNSDSNTGNGGTTPVETDVNAVG